MSRSQARTVRRQAWVALLLALAGGGVDGVGYLVLYHLFTAHMSGNSIAMGVHAGQADWHQAFHRGFAIPLFVLGIAAGAALSEALARGGARHAFGWVLGLETALLGAFLAWGGAAFHDGAVPREPAWRLYGLAALPALAMGLQNAALRRVGKASVHTTYISGTLTSLAEGAVEHLYWLRDHRRGRHPRPLGLLLRLSPRRPAFNRLCLWLGLWVCYVAGAIVCTLATLRWQLLSLAGPVAVLAALVAFDLAHPLSPPPPGRKAQWRP